MIATLDDIPRLVDMGRKFHAQSQQAAGFDAAAVEALLVNLITQDNGCVIIGEYGGIGGILSPAYCDPAWMMAVELFWWAERDGLKLLSDFEAWASEKNANEIRMTTLACLPRADGILRRKGYAASEISYTKVIPWH